MKLNLNDLNLENGGDMIAVFARKKQCVYCNPYVRQNLRVRCSLNFEFGT